MSGKSFNTVGMCGNYWNMSENVIAGFFEESKGILKKEDEAMIEQTKEMLGECKRKALSKF